uniref:Protein PAM68, chloroplastic n=1 Tax=Kalanchoe fedtschenkoi TaxID=63787 RepID=A0A7N0UX28_KALFE
MQSSTSLTQPSPPLAPPSNHRSYFHISRFPSSKPQPWRTSTLLCASLKPTPKGFGPKNLKKPTKTRTNAPDDDDDEEEEEAEDSVIPEVVTNRMMGRIGLSVGIPLFIGLLFFPFFYYLKVVLKIDIPSFIPVMVSFVFFGAALAGVSYGIVSTSWDPLREGSLLGWNEAQRNWPVFWSSIWNGGSKSKKLK